MSLRVAPPRRRRRTARGAGMRYPRSRTLACVAFLAALALAPGCYRRVSYRSPDGRQVELVNVGFDTSIGSLHAQTPGGSLRLENVDSQALLAQRVAELAAALTRQGDE